MMDPVTLGMLVEVERDMLADGWVVDVPGDVREIVGAEHLHVGSHRERGFADVRHDVARVLSERGYAEVNDLRVQERAVAGDLNDDVRGQLSLRVDDALQDIFLTAPVDGNVLSSCPALDRVVGRRHRRRDDYRVHEPATPQAANEPREGRNAADVHQHLAGQARGAHARFDAGDGARAHAGRASARSLATSARRPCTFRIARTTCSVRRSSSSYMQSSKQISSLSHMRSATGQEPGA